MRVLASLTLWPVLLAYIVAQLSAQRFWINDEILSAKKPLWVIAHPDDESFFFGPTLARLLEPSRRVTGQLLCLSVGNHEGLGSTRRKELKASCRVWGIADSDCISLDDELLQDDPKVWWNEAAVNSVVLRHLDMHKNDLIISFDGYGVSGHSNHRALADALRMLPGLDKSVPSIYAVQSSTVVAKFSGLLTLPLVVVTHIVIGRSGGSGSLIASSLRDYAQAHASFNQHRSQWRWYRTLFVLFSRYLWFVELQKV